jgi:hypothetical protein
MHFYGTEIGSHFPCGRQSIHENRPRFRAEGQDYEIMLKQTHPSQTIDPVRLKILMSMPLEEGKYTAFVEISLFDDEFARIQRARAQPTQLYSRS